MPIARQIEHGLFIALGQTKPPGYFLQHVDIGGFPALFNIAQVGRGNIKSAHRLRKGLGRRPFLLAAINSPNLTFIIQLHLCGANPCLIYRSCHAAGVFTYLCEAPYLSLLSN